LSFRTALAFLKPQTESRGILRCTLQYIGRGAGEASAGVLRRGCSNCLVCQDVWGCFGRMPCAPTGLRHHGAAECCRGLGCPQIFFSPPRMELEVEGSEGKRLRIGRSGLRPDTHERVQGLVPAGSPRVSLGPTSLLPQDWGFRGLIKSTGQQAQQTDYQEASKWKRF